MNATVRVSLGLAALAALWGALNLERPELMPEDVPNPDASVPAVQVQLDREEVRAVRLEEQRQGVLRRIQRKAAILKALAADETTLLEAAARFRELDLQPPDYNWEAFYQFYPGATDAERHCREVIMAAECYLWGDLCVASLVCDRLERELKEHLARGTLHLKPCRGPRTEPPQAVLEKPIP